MKYLIQYSVAIFLSFLKANFSLSVNRRCMDGLFWVDSTTNGDDEILILWGSVALGMLLSGWVSTGDRGHIGIRIVYLRVNVSISWGDFYVFWFWRYLTCWGWSNRIAFIVNYFIRPYLCKHSLKLTCSLVLVIVWVHNLWSASWDQLLLIFINIVRMIITSFHCCIYVISRII